MGPHQGTAAALFQGIPQRHGPQIPCQIKTMIIMGAVKVRIHNGIAKASLCGQFCQIGGGDGGHKPQTGPLVVVHIGVIKGLFQCP